ncbi:MAG: porin [Burkholderiales bacterium]|nr:porin [Burkholderiales bacterium]
MKMKLIPAAILASMSMIGAAHADVTVYGLFDLAYGHTDGADDTVDFSRNSTTRLGVKGSTDLGSGIKGNFQLEAGNPQAVKGANEPFFNRQAWAGLAGKFGEVRAGTQDSVTFQTLIPYDLNYDSNRTAAADAAGVPTYGGQNTISKTTVMYISPDMSGFQARVSATQKGNNTGTDPRAKSMYALGLSYNNGPLSVGAAFETGSTDDTTSLRSNAFSGLGLSYDLGVVKVSGAAVNGGTTAAGLSGRGTIVGIQAPIAGATFGVQYAKNSDTQDTGTEFFANKEVLKNTTAYLDYGIKTPNVGAKVVTYSVGMIYAF